MDVIGYTMFFIIAVVNTAVYLMIDAYFNGAEAFQDQE